MHKTQETINRLPSGWIVSEKTMYRFPSGVLLTEMPDDKMLGRPHPFQKTTQSIDILYVPAQKSEEWQLYQWYKDGSQFKCVMKRKPVSGIKGNWGSMAAIDIGGDFIAHKEVKTKVATSKGNWVHSDEVTGVHFSEIRGNGHHFVPGFVVAEPTRFRDCFWVYKDGKFRIYNARSKSFIGDSYAADVTQDELKQLPGAVSLSGKVAIVQEKIGIKTKYTIKIKNIVSGENKEYLMRSFLSFRGCQFVSENHLILHFDYPLLAKRELWILDLSSGYSFLWKQLNILDFAPKFVKEIADPSAGVSL